MIYHMTKSKVCPRCNKTFITDKKRIHCSKDCQSLTQSMKNRILSKDQLDTIAILYYDDEMTGKEIAKIFGVHCTTIYHILNKRRYKDHK